MEQESSSSSKTLTSYMVVVDNILHRMRFPKFLVLCRDELGEDAESLFEGLLEHGRLSLEQVVQRAAARQGKSEAEVEALQKQAFAALVRSHYIERCPAAEPTLRSEALDGEKPKKAQRGSVKSKAKSLKDALKLGGGPGSEEARILAASAALDTERFRMPASLEDMGETSTSTSAAAAAAAPESAPNAGGAPAAPAAVAGQKRKADALALDAKTMAIIDEKEVLWRPNYEELVRKLRHQACVTEANGRLDSAAGVVLEAMLQSSRGQESSPKQRFSVPLSMSMIMEAVASTPAGRTMTLDRIRGALQQMSSASIGFLTRSGENGSSYIINIQKIIEFARRKEVEAIVLQRFGRQSCRIYRLLMMKGQMEQKQIAGMAMVQLKGARELLYRLLKEKYVVVQEVAKTAEHSAQKSFYLWNINWQTVQDLVLNDMYHAAANLGQRLAHELQQEQEVLELLKEIQAAKTAGTESHVTLTQRQHEQVKRIRRVASVLESSLLRLDDTIMLFHNF